MQSAVSGDHTRTVSIVAPTIGGLMKFAVRTVTCLGCKAPLKPGSLSEFALSIRRFCTLIYRILDNAVCPNCRPRTAELHSKQVSCCPFFSKRNSIDPNGLLCFPAQYLFSIRDCICKIVDTMSKMSRIASSSTYSFLSLTSRTRI